VEPGLFSRILLRSGSDWLEPSSGLVEVSASGSRT